MPAAGDAVEATGIPGESAPTSSSYADSHDERQFKIALLNRLWSPLWAQGSAKVVSAGK